MNNLITEDIIKNAVNESIDKFMLEEWGNAFKGALNGLKNGVSMYMDWRTNGQWNKKYNINATGNGKIVGSYYLNKWFKTRYNRLYDIIWGNYYGNRQYFYTEINGNPVSFSHNWKNNQYILNDKKRGITYNLQANEYGIPTLLKIFNNNGEIANIKGTDIKHENNSYYFNCENNKQYSLTVYVGKDNSTPESYISQNCRPENFISETQNGLGDGDFRKAVIAYLNDIQKENNERINLFTKNPKEKDRYNYNNVLKLFSVANFYEWWSKNANNIKGSENTKQSEQQNQENDNYNPNWYKQNYQPPNNNQHEYNSSGFDDVGHDAPGNNNNNNNNNNNQEVQQPYYRNPSTT